MSYQHSILELADFGGVFIPTEDTAGRSGKSCDIGTETGQNWRIVRALKDEKGQLHYLVVNWTTSKSQIVDRRNLKNFTE